jgi:hypothetical protein
MDARDIGLVFLSSISLMQVGVIIKLESKIRELKKGRERPTEETRSSEPE